MKKNLLFLLGLTASLMLGACGKKTAQEQTVLNVWQTETDPEAIEVLKQVGKQLEQAHPGVEVRIESVAWDALATRINLAIAGHNVPDLCHLEPFMAYSLCEKGYLLPLDDLLAELESNDRIFAAVRHLQTYDGKTYGLAYAVGTTGWAYRRDLAEKAGVQPPKKWTQYPEFVAKLKQVASPETAGVTLPGGSPFFIDQLFAELVANNRAVLFDPNTQTPRFNTPAIVEVFEFFAQLRPVIDSSWTTTSYLDQFNRLGRGEVLAVPVAYARAGRSIEKVIHSDPSATSGLNADDSTFALMEQPTGPSYDGPSIATIDCEPYVIFKEAGDKPFLNTTHAALAKEFMRLFYQRDNYLKFTRTVPIHLTPIFEGIARSPDYRDNNPYLKAWKSWAEQTDRFLADPQRTRPILMPDISEKGRTIPYLLNLQASRLISNEVLAVLRDGKDPRKAAEDVQTNVEKLYKEARAGRDTGR